MTTALLLINPKSRSGLEAREEALRLLQEQGIDCRLPDDPDEDWNKVLKRCHEDIDLVIVGGGDGSVRALASSLIELDLTLGILPLGTANDLSRTLAIPTDLAAACEIIATGDDRLINVGLANDEPFFNVANIGLGVEVNRQLSDTLKKRAGIFSYLIAAMKAWWVYRPFTAFIEIDGMKYRYRVLQLAIGNGCYYGGGMCVHDKADISENLLSVYLIRTTRLLSLVLSARSFRLGKMENIQGALKLKSRKLKVSTQRPHTVMADGETLTRTPATFEVLADAVRVRVPKAESEQN